MQYASYAELCRGHVCHAVIVSTTTTNDDDDQELHTLTHSLTHSALNSAFVCSVVKVQVFYCHVYIVTQGHSEQWNSGDSTQKK